MVDVLLRPGGLASQAFAALPAVLARAEDLSRAGHLLSLPALPEVVALRDWSAAEVARQLAGRHPTAWPGGVTDLGTAPVDVLQARPVPGWDAAAVTGSAACLVAGDERNRIVAVSAPAARLLGWDAADLVGRRVTVLVPPSLREAHIAGFTRHLSGGGDRVLDRDLVLPVQHAAGHQVTCGFRLSRAARTGTRRVWVARLQPQDGG